MLLFEAGEFTEPCLANLHISLLSLNLFSANLYDSVCRDVLFDILKGEPSHLLSASNSQVI